MQLLSLIKHKTNDIDIILYYIIINESNTKFFIYYYCLI